MLSVGSLFTGCMGLDLGLEATGAYRVAWACENDPACRRVIARHRPGLAVHDDVRDAFDWADPVDVLVGGFPCQDLSYAGKGAGLDGDRSGLWHAYADCIRLVRPRLVLVENVPGLATRGLGRVLYDLAEAGYVGRWIRLRAADVGAPHGRERIFIVARDADAVGRGRWPDDEGRGAAGRNGATPTGSGAPADAGRDGRDRRAQRDGEPSAGFDGPSGRDIDGRDLAGAGPDDGHAREALADAECIRGCAKHQDDVGLLHAGAGSRGALADADGREREPSGQAGYETGAAAAPISRGIEPAPDAGSEPGESGGGWRAPSGDRARADEAQRDGRRLVRPAEPGQAVEWGVYGPAVERWERILGRAAPRPTDDRGRLEPVFVEWMLGFPDGWTAGEKRTQRLRMLGNAVQVQCGTVAGLLLLELEAGVEP